MTMTETQEQEVVENPFPDKRSLRCFLSDVEESLLGYRVPKDKVHIVTNLIKKHFPADNLPEKNIKPMF